MGVSVLWKPIFVITYDLRTHFIMFKITDKSYYHEKNMGFHFSLKHIKKTLEIGQDICTLGTNVY